MKLTLIVTILLALQFAIPVDSSAMDFEGIAQQLRRIAMSVNRQNLRVQRDTENSDMIENRRSTICHASMPCGWAGYVPFTRRINLFMKNTCECPDTTYKCVRVDDDLSVSAYVYRCRQNTTAEDIEPEYVN